MNELITRLKKVELAEYRIASDMDCAPESTSNYGYAVTCREAINLIEELARGNEELKAKFIKKEVAYMTGQKMIIDQLRKDNIELTNKFASPFNLDLQDQIIALEKKLADSYTHNTVLMRQYQTHDVDMQAAWSAYRERELYLQDMITKIHHFTEDATAVATPAPTSYRSI
jgi:hypothetical protein